MCSSTDTSLSIWLIIPSMSSPCMNCSVNLLSYLPQSQSASFVCNLPIHSCTHSWLILFILRCCSNSNILLWCSLNLWLSTTNSTFAIFFLFICKSFYELPALPTWPVLHYQDLLHQSICFCFKNVHDLCLKVKKNSIYLSWAFQMNEGFSKASPLCLCQDCCNSSLESQIHTS